MLVTRFHTDVIHYRWQWSVGSGCVIHSSGAESGIEIIAIYKPCRIPGSRRREFERTREMGEGDRGLRPRDARNDVVFVGDEWMI